MEAPEPRPAPPGGAPPGAPERRPLLRRLVQLLRGDRIIHEKHRPRGVTALALFALSAGVLAAGGGAAGGRPELLAAGGLLLAAGAGLLRRYRWSLHLTLGMAAAGAAGSAGGLAMGAPLPVLGGSSAWGWLLALWYSLIVFFYLRQRKVVETF